VESFQHKLENLDIGVVWLDEGNRVTALNSAARVDRVARGLAPRRSHSGAHSTVRAATVALLACCTTLSR